MANGTGNAKILMEKMKNGEADYTFIEVMGCPGGCVTGGGQPIVPARDRMKVDPRVVRAKALYTEDESKAQRKSHQNAAVQKLYEDYLGQPNSHKAHELLHTHYVDALRQVRFDLNGGRGIFSCPPFLSFETG